MSFAWTLALTRVPLRCLRGLVSSPQQRRLNSSFASFDAEKKRWHSSSSSFPSCWRTPRTCFERKCAWRRQNSCFLSSSFCSLSRFASSSCDDGCDDACVCDSFIFIIAFSHSVNEQQRPFSSQTLWCKATKHTTESKKFWVKNHKPQQTLNRNERLYLLFLLLHILTPVRWEKMKKQGSYVDLTQGATEDVHKHILSNGYVLVVVVWAENVSLFLFPEEEDKIVFSCGLFSWAPHFFCVTLFARDLLSFAERRARERGRERERFTRVLGPSLEGDFVISYERKSARARVLSHSGSFLGEWQIWVTIILSIFSLVLSSTKKNTHIIETSYSHLSSFIHYIITENKMVPRSNQRSCAP